MLDYEEKQKEHNESSDDSSQASASRLAVNGLRPPAIETQLATDRSRRSKTVVDAPKSQILAH